MFLKEEKWCSGIGGETFETAPGGCSRSAGKDAIDTQAMEDAVAANELDENQAPLTEDL